MENNQECPICGCKEIGEGMQRGQGSMYPIGNIWTPYAVISKICTECGHILSSRVENPRKFKTKS